MKKKKLPKNINTAKSFGLILFAIVLLLYLDGCTTKTLQLAREKASPHFEYWNLKRAVSALVEENGDISICAEFSKAGENQTYTLNTITLPLAILTGETSKNEMLGLRPAECPINGTLCYWYPIEKVDKSCDKFAPENLAAKSFLPIVKLTVNSDDQEQLYDLLNSYNKSHQVADRIFEVHYVTEDHTLIYWPFRRGQQGIQAISIAGTYEDKSTYLHYLKVPAAFIGDVIVVAATAAVYTAGIALGVFLRLH